MCFLCTQEEKRQKELNGIIALSAGECLPAYLKRTQSQKPHIEIIPVGFASAGPVHEEEKKKDEAPDKVQFSHVSRR